MRLWHATPDARRTPERVLAGERVSLSIGTWPIESAQEVWVSWESGNGTHERGSIEAKWSHNTDVNSYWLAELGPFAPGAFVRYAVHGRSPYDEVETTAEAFRVARPFHVAVLWHQHQPLYRDPLADGHRGSYLQPWVRLHALRDYYSMAALVERHPDLHLTINLTPVLLRQILDYVENGATDRALELTTTPVEQLGATERQELISTFFDADWHNQIFPHPRYKELFGQRRDGIPFSDQDVRDLQMWFNLAWFGSEFREGTVRLVTGKSVSVQRFARQQRNFTLADIQAMVTEQHKLLEAVVPIHRALQDRGQIEVSTTPYFHPILPLLIDTDHATIDRPGALHPPRFAYPADALEHVRRAAAMYGSVFGHAPSGMWPAEGAVSRSSLPAFARNGVQWIATDGRVLARSGRWGYEVQLPDVLCQPYRDPSGGRPAIFFRDPGLSDAIGFRYHAREADEAARELIDQIRERFAREVCAEEDHVLTIALDGENAWGAYRDDARPFLHALYGLLEREPAIVTVTFSEYLAGNPARGVQPHPAAAQRAVHELFTGSWADESGSAPGVDLGTWIGEAEENEAWQLLTQVREELERTTVEGARRAAAMDAVLAAEASDWFWWFGSDQESGNDEEFDDLFRRHLKSVYRHLGVPAPEQLERHIVPHAALWTFTDQITTTQRQDRLSVRTNCPGILTWRIDEAPSESLPLTPAGGVMAGSHRFHTTLGPFSKFGQHVRFRFRCTEPGCPGGDVCCSPHEHQVELA